MPHILPCQHKLTHKKVKLIFKIEIIFFIHFILLCLLGNQIGVKNPESSTSFFFCHYFPSNQKWKTTLKFRMRLTQLTLFIFEYGGGREDEWASGARRWKIRMTNCWMHWRLWWRRRVGMSNRRFQV